MENKIAVLVDNGHGDPPLSGGKQSPDGSLREYYYTRDIAREVVARLCANGVNAILLTPEKRDIGINERVRRANDYSAHYGAKNTLLVSIHNDAAASDGKWKSARGWSAIVSSNASQRSYDLAAMLFDEADHAGLKTRRQTATSKSWVRSDLGLLKRTSCPAVLTENLFQDNREDVAFLLSPNGRETIISLHVNAIKKYIEHYVK